MERADREWHHKFGEHYSIECPVISAKHIGIQYFGQRFSLGQDEERALTGGHLLRCGHGWQMKGQTVDYTIDKPPTSLLDAVATSKYLDETFTQAELDSDCFPMAHQQAVLRRMTAIRLARMRKAFWLALQGWRSEKRGETPSSLRPLRMDALQCYIDCALVDA